ncbi:MAG: hypothetical protein HC849_27500 [Oscillatoriales cyanobacterium RU_3_3]|nr:hypothetical protein [Oscillatoriales cyanobacterium RU_3_3]NJR23638.1 hypothetical protein [Richelia sp. CSU_2_1]
MAKIIARMLNPYKYTKTDAIGHNINDRLSQVNCQLSQVNCQLSTVNCQLSTVNSLVATASQQQSIV